MSRSYSKSKVVFNRWIERFFFILLYPFILAQKQNGEKVKNILLVEPFQMGDILSLTPLIEPLINRYPQSKISFLTKPGSGKILEFDSRIDRVFAVDFPWSDHGQKRLSFGRMLAAFKSTFDIRKHNFDLGIDTRGDVRSQALLILAGCRTRLGYLNYLHSNVNLSGLLLTNKLKKSKYYHRYEWNLDLLTALKFQEKQLFPIQFPSFIPDKILFAADPILRTIVLHVGGGWIYRRWSETKWIELIHILQEKPHQKILVIGGAGEKDVLQTIESHLIKRKNVEFIVSTLEQLIIHINQSALFIGLDSGPMNLAVCLNKNNIALFGPGDSAMWRPLNKDGKFIQKVDKFPCSPCLQLECIFPKKNCMQEIEVEDVIGLPPN